ncbi:MAG: DUF86 domain-containing protein [Patescibacteria group bacterium]
MTNLDVVENKISQIRKYLKLLAGFKKLSEQKIALDPILSGALLHYLYVATQATIDLAEAVISFKKFRKPTIYSENFDILYEEKLISGRLKESLRKMAGFRNFIAHDYGNVDFAIVYGVLKEGTKDIEKFAKLMAEKLKLN